MKNARDSRIVVLLEGRNFDRVDLIMPMMIFGSAATAGTEIICLSSLAHCKYKTGGD